MKFQLFKKSLRFQLLITSIAIIAVTSCKENVSNNIVGKWKVMGEERVLEFTEEGYYNVYLNGENIFQDIEGYGRLHFSAEMYNDSLYVLVLDETMENQLLKAYMQIEDSVMTMIVLGNGSSQGSNANEQTVLRKIQ